MNTNDMLKKLGAAVSTREEAESKKKSEMRRLMKEHVNAILANIEKVKSVAPVVSYIYQNKLVDTSNRFGRDNDFLSGGIYHKCGFSEKTFSLWGVTGGGWDGPSVFVNLTTGNFRICGMYDELNAYDVTADMMINSYDGSNGNGFQVRRHLEKMAKGVSDYVKSVEDFVATV